MVETGGMRAHMRSTGEPAQWLGMPINRAFTCYEINLGCVAHFL